MDLHCDYVVVGTGSAGAVLTNRLSADPAVAVVALEAGPRDKRQIRPDPSGVREVVSQ